MMNSFALLQVSILMSWCHGNFYQQELFETRLGCFPLFASSDENQSLNISLPTGLVLYLVNTDGIYKNSTMIVSFISQI